jgi:hypothetical protein
MAPHHLVALQGELEAAGIRPHADAGWNPVFSQTSLGLVSSIYVAGNHLAAGREIAEAYFERVRAEEERVRRTCPACGVAEGRELNRSSCLGLLLSALMMFAAMCALAFWWPIALLPLWLLYGVYTRYFRYLYCCPGCGRRWK